jgi:hypothetical protein
VRSPSELDAKLQDENMVITGNSAPTDDLDDATIEKIGNPDKVISAFGPEVIGENVEGKVLSSATAEYSGRTYYQFELEPPHVFITATAAGNRLYLFSVTASGKKTFFLISETYDTSLERFYPE